MKKIAFVIIVICLVSTSIKAQQSKCVKLSCELLDAIKNQKDYSNIQFLIGCIQPDSLAKDLSTDEKREAFWINIFNAFVQINLVNDKVTAAQLDVIFDKEIWIVARRNMSVNDIEQQVLSRHRYPKGLFHKQYFPTRFVKTYRFDSADYRIHVATSYKSKDCPPVYILNSKDVNNQLNQLTKTYLLATCKWVDSTKTLFIPKLIEQYYAAFGRHKGINKMMIRYGIIQEGGDYEHLETLPSKQPSERRKFAEK